MTDTTTTPTRPRTREEQRFSGRWVSDLHCLWRYCEKRGCQRARACRNDPGHCLHFMPLVPIEAREFMMHWDDSLADGLTFDEMLEEYAEEWEMLGRWNEMVHDTLPENRWKARAAFAAEQHEQGATG